MKTKSKNSPEYMKIYMKKYKLELNEVYKVYKKRWAYNKRNNANLPYPELKKKLPKNIWPNSGLKLNHDNVD